MGFNCGWIRGRLGLGEFYRLAQQAGYHPLTSFGHAFLAPSVLSAFFN